VSAKIALLENNFWILFLKLEHPAIGMAKSIANPIRFSNTWLN